MISSITSEIGIVWIVVVALLNSLGLLWIFRTMKKVKDEPKRVGFWSFLFYSKRDAEEILAGSKFAIILFSVIGFIILLGGILIIY
jgi:hypothetical protein